MISAILFDLGGTLDGDGLHWLDRFYSIYERSELAHLPKPLIKEAFYWADEKADADAAMKTAGLRQMMDLHVGWQFEKLQLKNAEAQALISAAFYKPAERVMRRNRHILEAFHQQGLKLGIISNFYGNVEALCREFGYTPFLDVVLDSMVCGLKKPDPRIFQLALQKMKVSASETAFVGDSFERDMVPAKNLGMHTFWMVDDHAKQPPTPGIVDTILYSLEDLPQRLRERQEKQLA